MCDKDLLEARTALEDILNALDVARVVYVDDCITATPTVEDTIAAALTIETAALQSLFPELGETPPDDPDVLRQKIHDVWSTLGPDIQAERGKAIVVAARRQDGDEPDDTADIAVLEQIIPHDRLVSLSPSEWEEKEEQLLLESQKKRTLFIFDRDLSRAEGGDPESGIKIIASLLAKKDSGGLMCGLLTHTITPETQPEQWEKLSDTYSIPMDRFVVIPKRHLSKSPILFAQTLKFAALSPDFAELKLKTKEIMVVAAETAADRVEKVSIYDLDHIVFQVSANEGLWEPDMLFRLHAMFHRLKSRELAHESGELEAIAAKLRAVRGIPTKSDHLPTPDSTWALQREELYEQDHHINKYHLPLELGDIFERVGAKSVKKYILLAQPCDLMVRGNGKRQPELSRIPIAEVVPWVSEDKPPLYSEEMPYFDFSPGKKWFVKFKSIHFVSGCLLDLCVFNQDGSAKLTFDGSVPSGIQPSWKARYDFLSRHWGKAIRKADVLAPVAVEPEAVKQVRKKIAKDLGSLLFSDGLFKGCLSEDSGIQSVSYNCRRVGRLSRARGIAMLMSYTATLGRPAFDRDFL